MLPESFLACLVGLSDCFCQPSYKRFLDILKGWLLCTGKHTVTGVLRATGVVGKRDHNGYHRFFSRARWEPDEVGLVLMRLVLSLMPRGRVRLTVDDTLGRHTGKRIAGGGMHRDPLLSCANRPFWHFGHLWVVVAVVVEFPAWNKRFSLPVLMRLYRTKKVNKACNREHKKRTELAAQMLRVIFNRFPERDFLLIGDNAYMNHSVVRNRPKNVHVLGRGRMDAALYRKAPTKKGRGRPPVKGKRVASPKDRRGQWQQIEVSIYGKPAVVLVRRFKAVWYKVSHGEEMLFVVVRNWPGHSRDDVLACTDVEMSASDVIALYCERWSLEETFGWAKSKLGFEDPQNRTERAVERTAPLALWSYTLVVVWYARWSAKRRVLPMRLAPWYTKKAVPSFADMLATLRRSSWTLWISDQAAPNRFDQKDLEPLLDAVGYA